MFKSVLNALICYVSDILSLTNLWKKNIWTNLKSIQIFTSVTINAKMLLSVEPNGELDAKALMQRQTDYFAKWKKSQTYNFS